MGDPRNYISPDVCVDFTSFKLIEDHGGKIKIEKNKNMAGTTSTITFILQNA